MLKLCFYQRLSISLVSGFLLILSLFVVASSHLQTSIRNEGEQQLHLELAAHLVSDNPLLKEGVYDYSGLKNLFHTLMLLGPSFEFYFVDPNGKILAYSAQNDKIVRTHVDTTPVIQLIEKELALPIKGDDPKDTNRQKIFSAAPVYNEKQLQGYLYVIIGGTRYDSVIDNLKESRGIQQFAMMIIAGSIFLLFALLLLFRYLTRPLKVLSDDMEQFRASGFNIDNSGVKLRAWSKDSYNEVQRLGSAFNDMLQHIDLQMNKLKQIDSERRTLLADLSHDLRTPLANLQGYIETLSLNGNNFNEEERQRFINISLKNLLNLKRLIDQIFELAYLEGGNVTLKKETFMLAELLHDIAAKFSITAQKKQISLTVNSGIKNAYIHADIGKLERVLTNLIENAIRHTPEGGAININVVEGDDSLKVEIKDTGVGISERELQHIFDARYQASNCKKDTAIHVGLGLAISQKLIRLLDSTLSVQSQLGEGTCFSFELTIADPL